MAHELIFEEVVGHVIENRFEKWKKKNMTIKNTYIVFGSLEIG